MNLAQHISAGSLEFIEILDHVHPASDSVAGVVAMRPIMDLVTSALAKCDSSASPLVILDDITSLEWLGFTFLDLSRFLRALGVGCARVGIFVGGKRG